MVVGVPALEAEVVEVGGCEVAATSLKLAELMMDPPELTVAILELVSKDRVLGEIGPDRLIP